jgi:hypothetical protein
MDAEDQIGRAVYKAAEGLANRNVAQNFDETVMTPGGGERNQWGGFSVPAAIADRVETELSDQGHTVR